MLLTNQSKDQHDGLGKLTNKFCGVRCRLAFATYFEQKVGICSHSLRVTSGVFEGFVGRSKLFLSYTNDLLAQVSRQVSLFADDTLLFEPVNNVADINFFQEVINKLDGGRKTWGVELYVAKTQLNVFNKYTTVKLKYLMNGPTLRRGLQLST